jgi:tetratricopeptide (TPR) repeat protein
MSDQFSESVERAHADVQGIFRTSIDDTPEACRQACDRLAAVRGFDPDDPDSWKAGAILAADLRVLLGFLAEARVPSVEPPEFRALVLKVLQYLYLAREIGLGVILAEAICRRWTEDLGPDHPDRIIAIERHAACLLSTDAEAALPLFEEALERWSRVRGPEDRDTLNAAANLCACLQQIGDYTAALQLSQYILPICRRVLGEDSDVTLRAASGFAASLFALGEYSTALSAYRDIHERYLRMYSADHLFTLNAASNVAITLAKIGDFENARGLNEDILRRYERLLGKKDAPLEDYKEIEWARDRLSANLRALGRDDEARAVYGPLPDF